MKKQGFTLAELLLCVGIIGIVGAMGAMATKHSVEQTYRGYWYTGYVALSDSIADFEDNGRFTSVDATEQITSAAQFAERLHDIIGGTRNNARVTAPNNIIYDIAINNNASGNTEGYIITMTVPQEKTRTNQNGQRAANFYYPLIKKVLIPYPVAGAENLQNRVDLLPFYLEDGTKFNDNNTIRNKQYMDFQQAYCRAIHDSITINDTAVIRCEGINQGSSSGIKVANPRKVR